MSSFIPDFDIVFSKPSSIKSSMLDPWRRRLKTSIVLLYIPRVRRSS